MQQRIIRLARFCRPLLFIICLLCLCGGSSTSFAQTSKARADSLARVRQQAQAAQKRTLDSARESRTRILDSTRTAQKEILDSARESRQHILDSTKAVRKRTTDSLTAIRKYRESKRYKDSVTRSRERRVASIRDVQKARLDSIRAARKEVTDSMTAARKEVTDALKAKQKKRSDSLAAIRKYRESKRFRDSVTIVKKVRTDSIQAERKAIAEALAMQRKATIDSAKAVRKALTDSMTTARTKQTDSLKAIRKVKADSLAKVKADKEKAQKLRQKNQELKLNLALELKIKKKREAWNNEKMLKKKWSWPRQVVQNTFTRYNYYFNANRKMEEALANMQRIGRDNYDSRMALFTFDPNRDSAMLAPDMDSVIQKASLGIQIHDPRTKWGDDLYLLLGQAYFYKADYENAATAFQYIVARREQMEREKAKKKAFSNRSVKGKREETSFVVPDEKNKLLDLIKHESANNDALLWLARTYTQSGRYNEAESVLDLLGSDAKFPEDLRGRLALEKAFLALNRRNDREAVDQLALVAADKQQTYWIRRRAAFLAGQMLEDQGRYEAAAQQFDKVTDLQPGIEMDFYARKNKAYNLMLVGGRQEDAIASLKSMVRDGKYTAYYEQIYYVLGMLSANSGNAADATEYLQKSLASPKTTKKQKASSFAALGNIYYAAGNYEGAKSTYDSAASLAMYAQGDSSVNIAVRRGKVLDQVAIPARTIRTQDSLLALAAMSEREQRAVVRRYIRSLEQQRLDSAFRAENAGINSVAQQGGTGDPGVLSWYFANPVQMQQGMTEFKKKWGNRPLADNWRRASAIGMTGQTPVAQDPGTPAGSDPAGGVELDEKGLPTEESLLAGIPSTPAGKEEALRKIQRAYVDLGNAYARQLEDYPRAVTALDTLDKRFASHPYMAEELYVRYLIALRQNNLTAAQQYSNQLQQQYAGTPWADLVRPTEDGSGLTASTTPLAEFYDETYGLLMQRQYGEVLSRTRTARRQYADEHYGDRFRIMEAIALAGSGVYDQADTLISEFMRTHPADSLTIWAESVKKYITAQRKLDSAKGPAAIQMPAPGTTIPVKTVDTAAVQPLVAPEVYAYKAAAPHYFVFYFQRMEPRTMGVKAGLNDFNTLRFSGQDLESIIEPFPDGSGVILTRTFKNAAGAKAYLAKFREASVLTREFKNDEYKIFVISGANYLKLKKDRDIPAYLNFYRTKY